MAYVGCGPEDNQTNDASGQDVSAVRIEAGKQRYETRGRIVAVEQETDGTSNAVHVVIHIEAVPEFVNGDMKTVGLLAGEHRFRVMLIKQLALDLKPGEMVKLTLRAIWPMDGEERILVMDNFSRLPAETQLEP